ncbi:hypothetical protein O1R50_19760 [Glycomyces luteolus]|uniref:AAA domain-containing protein n=1 Tax=Glycomyces luteolus TaxID=2670330 RepID=A0A9X3ST55_9ACTN|nr:hypothetical protein [Glycomyces luteolus]MDA1361874.1 hypothetical protein [Glycomyces luteolus]
MDHVEALLIGGRAGVGKTTVGWEVSAQLAAAGVAHAYIEGDMIGQLHPAPAGDPDRVQVTERNLAAMWAEYARLGCRRLVYTRTVSVLPEYGAMIQRALTGEVRLIRILLTASDATAVDRLTRREQGSRLEAELRTTAQKAPMLEARAPAGTVRVGTDDRPVTEIAKEVIAVAGWLQ